MAAKQLAVVPYSSIHEDESHQWSSKGTDLWKYIKDAAIGYEFEAAYDVDRTQLLKAFQARRSGQPSAYAIEETEALEDNVHQWHGYYYITVGRYVSDVEAIRTLKNLSVQELVAQFDGWQSAPASFADDLEVEFKRSADGYFESYADAMSRLANRDFMAFLEAPVSSKVIEHMLRIALAAGADVHAALEECNAFFASDHFRAAPIQRLRASIFATLKAMVRQGAYANRAEATSRLSGFFFDVMHVSTYAPYVDAVIVDQPMAEMLRKPTVSLESSYGTKVFSLTNWGELLAWLDAIEQGMSNEHGDALRAIYP